MDSAGARRRRIEEVCDAALDRDAGERAAFVSAACGHDDELRQEVEALLAHAQTAEGFLAAPMGAVAAHVLGEATGALLVGQQIGSYEILSRLGAGGMGEVYRARDPRLGRDIALKVLPADVTHDDTRRQWFEREARAAAVLDHPNICPIYDIGDQDGRIWIAMQYVEGETLADRLRRGPLLVSAALDVAAQIASALNTAHARGIVHRDVKPENVMIATTGQAKVLDFGLAKITTELAGSDPPQSAYTGVHSRKLGTLPYMSPEQVRGESLDARTDIFSLSVVLYEMVTGRRPFAGNEDAEIMTSIVSVTPPSVTDFVPTAPPALTRILGKGLEKDRSRRYQTMEALAEELAHLRSKERASPYRVAHGTPIMAAVMTFAVMGVAAWWSMANQEGPVRSDGYVPQYTRLTNFPDFVHSPVLSPDGTKLAFVRGAEPYSMVGVGSDLYLKSLPDGQPVALTHDGTGKSAPIFTPDGSRIVFTMNGSSSFSVPAIGGTPTLFMRNASGLRWIGPGKLLFSEMKTAPNTGIVTATEHRTSVRDIYVPSSAQGMAHFSDRSPDGTHVLIAEMDHATWLPCRLVPFDGSSQGRQVGPFGGECRSAAWSPDGRWMYFAAVVAGESHLWRQHFPDGVPEQLTFGPNEERGVVVDRDGRSVITSVASAQSTVWYHDSRGDRSVSVEGYAYRPLVSQDGSKVFYLIRRAPRHSLVLGELWTADLATGRNERLLPGFLMRSYHLSSDGKLIVFDALDDTDRSQVWVAALDRDQRPRRLTPDDSVEEQRPFFGRSGNIYFMQERSRGVYSLYRMKSDGSGRHEISERTHFLVSISPDEKWAASWENGPLMSLFPLDGGAPYPLCSCGLGPIYPDSPSVAWSGDGQWIHVFTGRRGTLRIPWQGPALLRNAAGRSPTDLEKLTGAQYISESSVAPGPTATTYAFVRQSQQSNLYRIRLP